MSLLDKLKEAIEADTIEIEVPAWKETFYVSPLNVQELAKLQKKLTVMTMILKRTQSLLK